MKILLILAVVSFAALAWAAFAIVRHIRGNASNSAATPETGMDQAIENRLSNLARPSGEHRLPAMQKSGQRDVHASDGPRSRPGTPGDINRHKVS